MKSLKIHFILFAVIFIQGIFNSLSAQRSGGGELGIMGGASYYMGDINLARPFYQPNLNLGGFYKHHLNSRYCLRVGFFVSSISGDDADFTSYYQNLRNHHFATSMMELSLQTEFNFLPYVVGEIRKRRYTPYLQTGLTYYLTPEVEKVVGFAIPIGVGFKVNLSRRIVLSTEWCFRRTFTDLLDNTTGEDLFAYNTVDNIPYDETTGIRQTGFRMNKDWYSYAAMCLSYSFSWGGWPCPAYDRY